MAIVGLDHVQVSAPRGCEADARRFYGALMGLAEIEKPEGLRRREHAGEQVIWDAALPGLQRFYTQDPWGNRIELLA
jgi:catechol 2,3-dioxygenase-like lactoylglutathione lyase family enzyme